MLQTLFITGFILVPLALAFVLIAYRARFFIVGVAAIALLLVLLWGGLKLAVMWDERYVPEKVDLNTGTGAAYLQVPVRPGTA